MSTRRRSDKRRIDQISESSPGEANLCMPSTPMVSSPALESTPMVFYCSSCRAIVADSTSAVCSDPDLKVLCFCRASNVKRRDSISTSTAGPDRGSTYFALHCCNCNSPLGKYYLSSSDSALSGLLKRFSFSVDHLSTYILGGGDIGDPSLAPTTPSAAASSTAALPSSALSHLRSPSGSTMESSSNHMDAIASHAEVVEDVLKLSHLVAFLQARIEKLERATGTSPPREFP